MRRYRIGIMVLALFLNLALVFTQGIAYVAPVPVSTESKELPFSIKYPSSWYLCEQGYGNSQQYFITKEPIRQMTDKFSVGITVTFLKDRLLNLAWEGVKSNQMAAYKSMGLTVEEVPTTTISGYPAFVFLIRSPQIKMFSVYIKKGNDLVNIVQEATLQEWANYEGLFRNNLSAIYLK